MEKVEFLAGMDLLKKQWPSAFGASRQQEMIERFCRLPEGVFLKSCKNLVFQGGPPPSGQHLQEVFTGARQGHGQVSQLEAQLAKLPDCETCDRNGSLAMKYWSEKFNRHFTKAVFCHCKAGELVQQVAKPQLERITKLGLEWETTQ